MAHRQSLRNPFRGHCRASPQHRRQQRLALISFPQFRQFPHAGRQSQLRPEFPDDPRGVLLPMILLKACCFPPLPGFDSLRLFNQIQQPVAEGFLSQIKPVRITAIDRH